MRNRSTVSASSLSSRHIYRVHNQLNIFHPLFPNGSIIFNDQKSTYLKPVTSNYLKQINLNIMKEEQEYLKKLLFFSLGYTNAKLLFWRLNLFIPSLHSLTIEGSMTDSITAISGVPTHGLNFTPKEKDSDLTHIVTGKVPSCLSLLGAHPPWHTVLAQAPPLPAGHQLCKANL